MFERLEAVVAPSGKCSGKHRLPLALPPTALPAAASMAAAVSMVSITERR